jgi:hypothetical protein
VLRPVKCTGKKLGYGFVPGNACHRNRQGSRPPSDKATVQEPHLPEGDLNEVACGHGNRGRDILLSSVQLLQREGPLAESHKAPANDSLQRESIVAP